MSQPKQYSPALEPGRGSNFNGLEVSMREDLAGKWVSLSDYAALAAENERLTAEVEWLRKADRLVCWNAETQEWQVRFEAPK